MFLEELRRRKVFRVAIIYGIAAWAILQIVTTVAPLLRLPDWTATLVLLLLAVGFPVALILAWAFELTPEGVIRTPAIESTTSPTPTPSGRHRAAYFALGMVIALVGFAFYARREARNGGSASDGGRIESIAVLPFADLSAQHDQEYFSDGITEELLDALAKVPGLRVPARTSSFQYKGKAADIREVGRQLNVQTVLEGSVRKSGNRVRITAQLINARNGYHIWPDTYDRDLTDVFALQDELSRTIVDQLKVKLAGESEQKVLVEQTTADPEAHSLYLQGRHFLGTDAARAIEYFNRALARDPKYALAYAGIADAYADSAADAASDARPDREAELKAKAAARKALELDGDLAEAHTSAGMIFLLERDMAAAARELNEALRLNPNYARAYAGLALLHRYEGKSHDAVTEMNHAYSLNPLSLSYAYNLGRFLWEDGQDSAAIAFLKQTEELLPGSSDVPNQLARIYAVAGRGDEAVAQALLSYQRGPETANIDEIAAAYAVAGNKAEALRWAKRYEVEGPTGDQRYAILLAVVYARLNDPANATRWLERAVSLPKLAFGEDRGAELKPDRRIEILRADPRYHALLKQLELM